MYNIILDENIPYSVGVFLKTQGFHVQFICDIAQGCSDDEIIEKFFCQDVIFITNDTDFGTLLFSKDVTIHNHFSLLLVRKAADKERLKSRLLHVLRQPEIQGYSMVLGATTLRKRPFHQ